LPDNPTLNNSEIQYVCGRRMKWPYAATRSVDRPQWLPVLRCAKDPHALTQIFWESDALGLDLLECLEWVDLVRWVNPTPMLGERTAGVLRRELQ
jgi:hypothetical protein